MGNKDKKTSSLLPEGELPCIWMLAGVVNYKLCEHKYECDQCGFDRAMTERAEPAPQRRLPQAGAPAGAKAVEVIHLNQVSLKPFDVGGYKINGAYFYHMGHTWARIEEEGRVRIGLDDFAQKLLGRIISVKPAEIARKVAQGESCWAVEHRGGIIELACPVDGYIVRVNEKLARNPSLLNFDPYGGGWVMIINPLGLLKNLKRLYYGTRVEKWYREEAEKLQNLLIDLSESSAAELGETMQDGGALEKGIIESLSQAQFRYLIEKFFSRGGRGKRPYGGR